MHHLQSFGSGTGQHRLGVAEKEFLDVGKECVMRFGQHDGEEFVGFLLKDVLCRKQRGGNVNAPAPDFDSEVKGTNYCKDDVHVPETLLKICVTGTCCRLRNES
jgi:hypothetical protein